MKPIGDRVGPRPRRTPSRVVGDGNAVVSVGIPILTPPSSFSGKEFGHAVARHETACTPDHSSIYQNTRIYHSKDMPMASIAYVKHAEWFLAIFLVDANRAMQDDQGARRRQRSRRHTRQWSRRGRERPRNPQWRPLVAAQSEQVAAIGMDGRSAIIGRRRSSGAPGTLSAHVL